MVLKPVSSFIQDITILQLMSQIQESESKRESVILGEQVVSATSPTACCGCI